MKIKNTTLMTLTLALGLAGSVYAAEEGDIAPDFTLPSIHAEAADITLSDLRGKVVYLDFWASWCAPCLKSLPLYNDMYHRYKDQGLEVVAVNVDNPIEDGTEWLIDTPLDFLIPADPDGVVPELYEVFGMPTSYLIDTDGTVKLVHMGFRDGDMEVIEAEVHELLAAQ